MEVRRKHSCGTVFASVARGPRDLTFARLAARIRELRTFTNDVGERGRESESDRAKARYELFDMSMVASLQRPRQQHSASVHTTGFSTRLPHWSV